MLFQKIGGTSGFVSPSKTFRRQATKMGTDYQTKSAFFYCLQNVVWTNQTINNFISASSHVLIDSSVKTWTKSIYKRSLNDSIANWLEQRAGKQGSLVWFPSEAHNFILSFFFAYFPWLTARLRPCKWNQAWHSSTVVGAKI